MFAKIKLNSINNWVFHFFNLDISTVYNIHLVKTTVVNQF